MSQVELRDLQTRSYENVGELVVFKAVINALQDEGFTIKLSDSAAGVLTASLSEKDINEGINATGILLFRHEVGGHAYLAPLEPHEWVDFKNNYGPDLSGCYWIDQLTPAPEFDGFADII